MSENVRSAPPQPQTRIAPTPAQTRTAPPPVAPPRAQSAPPQTPGTTPENLTIVPRLAGDSGPIDIDWEPMILGTNRSYGCVATVRTREPLTVTVSQAIYRRSFEGNGAVRVNAIPPAPAGTEGSLIARTSSGASVTYTWRWEPKSQSVGSAPTAPKRGLLSRLFGGGAAATKSASKTRVAKKAATIAERLGDRAKLACRVRFFGVETVAQRVAFVVDKSGSMDGARWQACIAQLEQALWNLTERAQFAIVLFDGAAYPASATWSNVETASLDAAITLLKNTTPSGGTSPGPAFQSVFTMSEPPDVVFFLTDGELGEFSVDQMNALKGNAPTVVNTVALENGAGSDALNDIASDSGGQFVFIADAANPVA
jgi:Mg-chelatase subunit ChlD